MPGMSSAAFHVGSRPGSIANVQVLSVRGAITYSTSPAFQDAISAAAASRLIVDLSEVSSIDSMAIGALVRAYVSCQKSGRKLLLVGLNHRVRNILHITGVDPLFETYATVSEAESALG
jgi:anti-sigma B factor antagonist